VQVRESGTKRELFDIKKPRVENLETLSLLSCKNTYDLINFGQLAEEVDELLFVLLLLLLLGSQLLLLHTHIQII
jgi:hypothetical protein